MHSATAGLMVAVLGGLMIAFAWPMDGIGSYVLWVIGVVWVAIGAWEWSAAWRQ